jgi:hypothetical protein
MMENVDQSSHSLTPPPESEAACKRVRIQTAILGNGDPRRIAQSAEQRDWRCRGGPATHAGSHWGGDRKCANEPKCCIVRDGRPARAARSKSR